MRILKKVDVVLHDDGILHVVGSVPDDNDEAHNCDLMGCSSGEHVLIQGRAFIVNLSVFDEVG